MLHLTSHAPGRSITRRQANTAIQITSASTRTEDDHSAGKMRLCISSLECNYVIVYILRAEVF